MRICDDLRQAVLQAAIQGKLTKQLPEDGNAADLLKHKHPLTNDEEKPFELPSSWIWVRLGDIGSFTRGSGIKRSEVTSEGFLCIRYGQLYTTYHNKIGEVLSKTSETVFKKSKKIKHGDIVMALTGENNYDIALAAAYIGHDVVAIGGDMTAFAHNVNPLYLVIAINSPYGIKCKSKLATGNIIVHISNDKLASIPVPLPPLAEQHRIVAKVEELMAQIDDLEKTETELEKLKATFPGDMKAALIQAAMQGRLTEQLPEDGDAADLINQIAKEKNQLIKEGKIKKEKPLPAITMDEMPFDIPDNWQWVRLEELGCFASGKTPKNSDLASSGKYPYFKVSDMNKKGNEIYLYFTENWLNENYKGVIFSAGSIVYPKNGGAVFTNKKRVLNADSLVDLNTGVFTFTKKIDNSFMFYLFSTLDFRKLYKGTALPTIDMDKVRRKLFPLPPLAEQKRIVEKLDKLLPLCDGLVEE